MSVCTSMCMCECARVVATARESCSGTFCFLSLGREDEEWNFEKSRRLLVRNSDKLKYFSRLRFY